MTRVYLLSLDVATSAPTVLVIRARDRHEARSIAAKHDPDRASEWLHPDVSRCDVARDTGACGVVGEVRQ